MFLGPRTYPCNSCRKSFTKNCNLNSHIKAVHRGPKLGSESSHSLSSVVFLGEKAFQCPDCLKSFSRNSDLQKHIDAVHKGLRPYKCSICQKLFSQKSSLKRHVEAVHEGECRASPKHVL
ncbi:unnamed protein product [Dibothriocephalus latus]|uniref:C2H2-type domain-containing protein n=1 Tax=Dibothriocephalus latus TaxID=60516 RepID=A0A3P7LV80_DIBLA|nr:unnamed protein product [Dibothriocephalus latus]